MDDLQNSRTSFLILNGYWFAQRTMLKQMGGCKSWKNTSAVERPLFPRIIFQRQPWDCCYGRLFYDQHLSCHRVWIIAKAGSSQDGKYHGKKYENREGYCSSPNHSQILTRTQAIYAFESSWDQAFQELQIIRILIIRYVIMGFISWAREETS